MILNNLRAALSGRPISIRVDGDKIGRVQQDQLVDEAEPVCLAFDNATVFPGLINSHDHLDFNVFPALGDQTYKNYTEWGRHLHRNYKEEINSVLTIPKPLREEWGSYKNLLCGVTTVVNHGKKTAHSTDVISVFENSQCIHSVRFEKNWRMSLNNPLIRKQPVVVHIGEGIDPSAFTEINQLIGWNLLKKNLVGVHGIAMNESQAKSFSALVWCPESNYFLFERTAPVSRLKKYVPILFGTDSTLTGNWNIWEHIRLARKTKFLTDAELFDSLTNNAANAWGLNTGKMETDQDADLVIAKTTGGRTGAEAFFAIEPKDILMVMHKGRISLFDEELYGQLTRTGSDHYSKVHADGSCKYVRGNLPALINKIKHYYPGASFPII